MPNTLVFTVDGGSSGREDMSDWAAAASHAICRLSEWPKGLSTAIQRIFDLCLRRRVDGICCHPSEVCGSSNFQSALHHSTDSDFRSANAS